ncbi:type III-B CRISPR module RAMP protein Cmr4 [Pelagibius sp. CAU 1746]|uniref:type III-B CRISPR module RAMP protein Cmr4 n=1 Tax=Pelagibius sp. CAU 1746 TaxID=3140370 RepID=UPI00325A91FC
MTAPEQGAGEAREPGEAMRSAMVGLIAETNVHVGIGQAIGALDLPVARERITDYPFVPGSGVKGAWRVWAEERAGLSRECCDDLFGPKSQSSADGGDEKGAGTVLMSDARLLLLPVRCLSSSYKWVTCPLILDRLRRDAARGGRREVTFELPVVEEGGYLGAGGDKEVVGLEEREFTREAKVQPGVLEALVSVIPGAIRKDRLEARLVVLSDHDFVWFARYALPVMARNALDENKIVKEGAFWYEESLPPDTVMYLLLGQRRPGKVAALAGVIAEDKAYLQMGGNETIGQGWFKMAVVGAREADQ